MSALQRFAACAFALVLAATARAQQHDHSQMDHARMDHGAPPPAAAYTEPATPVPPLADADRAAAFPELSRPMVHASAFNVLLVVDRLEAWDADPGTGLEWEATGWLGSDLDRVWLRTEGERNDGLTETAAAEILYGRSITAWWDVVAGVRHDFEPGSRTWAAFGIQGLSPYKFEVQATALLGESGRAGAVLEIEYELLLTNRLILQPLVELNVGSGLGTAEAGLRLRYEIRRRLAPYLGIVHERTFGDAADLRRLEGESLHDTRAVAGVRFWF
ncbi:MAG: copper resistance protein B [Steroidobacteraceae bacterium]